MRKASVIYLLLWLLLPVSTGAQYYQCDPDPSEVIFPPGIDQVGDPYYCPHIENPAYAIGQGPRVLFDEGHYNWGTISSSNTSPTVGTYFALGELLKATGFQVHAHQGAFDSGKLQGYRILILSHALRAPYLVFDQTLGKWTLNLNAFEVGSAYTVNEIQTIQSWVRNGGSVFVNAEHLPFTGAAKELTQAFGIGLVDQALGGFSFFGTFKKSTPTHPIFRGRNSAESISEVPFIAGGTRILSEVATPLFEYPQFSIGIDISPVGFIASFRYTECMQAGRPQAECDIFARIRDSETRYFDASGNVVAVAREYGRGRVVVFTEFASLTRQLIDSDHDGLPDSEFGGLRAGDSDFTQVILNIFYWLARLSTRATVEHNSA